MLSALLAAALLIVTPATAAGASAPAQTPARALERPAAPAAFQVAQATTRPPSAQRKSAKPATLEERRAARARQLRKKLKIQPSQEAALQAYVAAAVPPRAAPSRPSPQMTRLQSLDYEAAQLAAKTAALKKRSDATRRFYAALTPAQQAIFNAPPTKPKRK